MVFSPTSLCDLQRVVTPQLKTAVASKDLFSLLCDEHDHLHPPIIGTKLFWNGKPCSVSLLGDQVADYPVHRAGYVGLDQGTTVARVLSRERVASRRTTEIATW